MGGFKDSRLSHILRRVESDGSCIVWTRTTKQGYAMAMVGDKAFRVHKFLYELVNGKVPKGLELDHICRNRRCVNVDHLEAVTHKENCLRGNGIGAKNARKTKCHRGHEYDGRRDSRGYRECDQCVKAFYRKTYVKKIARIRAEATRREK